MQIQANPGTGWRIGLGIQEGRMLERSTRGRGGRKDVERSTKGCTYMWRPVLY